MDNQLSGIDLERAKRAAERSEANSPTVVGGGSVYPERIGQFNGRAKDRGHDLKTYGTEGDHIMIGDKLPQVANTQHFASGAQLRVARKRNKYEKG